MFFWKFWFTKLLIRNQNKVLHIKPSNSCSLYYEHFYFIFSFHDQRSHFIAHASLCPISHKIDIVGRGFLTHYFMKTSPILPTPPPPPHTHTHTHTHPPHFFKFYPTSLPFLSFFLLPCFFDWMGDRSTSVLFLTQLHYGSTHVKSWYLSTTRTLRCVWCNNASVYWGLRYDLVFCWYWFDITHTNKDTRHT